MPILHIDFETRSAVDLKAAGLDVYVKSETTDVWCMARAFDDGPVLLSLLGEECLPPVRLHVEAGGLVYAHNAAFEIAVWNEILVPRYGWPLLKIEQMRCTMAMSYAMAMPGGLENAAAAAGIDVRKDMAGRRVMLQMAKPKALDLEGAPIWHDDPEKLQRLYDYCKQDVEVERALHHRLLELSPDEQTMWQMDYRINQRGVQIDISAVHAAVNLVKSEQIRLNDEMRALTNNAVATCNATGQLCDWLRYQGVDMPSVAKAAVLDALADASLPPQCRAALLLRQEAAKSSTAKLTAMLDATGPDGRLRNMFQYHGAATGRWAGRKVQLHNLARYRDGVKHGDVARMFDLLHDRDRLDFEYGPVLNAIADCMRGFIVAAPGHDLIAADFANIEGRVLAWLAGEQWKLDAFRDYDAGKGPDLYILTYARSFGLDPSTIKKSDPRRQVGKVEELAFGYQGGVGAWRTMEKAYRPPPMTDDQVDDIKSRWREAHKAVVRFWYALESAAIEAVLNPGTAVSAGPHITFKAKGSFLFCRLPSGRLLSYPFPQIREIETPWGQNKDALTFKTELSSEARKKARIVEDSDNGSSWCRIATYGGSLAENVTQAVARDLLAEAMLRLDPVTPVVMHVHDEIVVEVPEDALADMQARVESIMAVAPAWASGLPIATEGWRGKRFRK